jgi:pyruvate formate lyase activating enzyme
MQGSTPTIPEEEFFEWLASRKKWLDGVCVTGGEPTLQADLPDFARKVKDAGFLFKLDSNGSNPTMLKEMLDAKLIDFLAMDIKAPLDKYESVVGASINKQAIEESVQLIQESGLDYEFRTTVAPDWYSKEDAIAIGEWLKGSKAYYLQNFVPDHAANPEFRKKHGFSREELEELKETLEPFFDKVGIRE